MSGIKLPAIVRPNGKTYQPRKIAVEAWENDNASDGWTVGAIVFGTHDVDFARPLATEAVRRFDDDMVALGAETGWYRDGFQGGERTWVDDPDLGRAGVWFRADYPPAPPVTAQPEETRDA
jgi:hypothetical protein